MRLVCQKFVVVAASVCSLAGAGVAAQATDGDQQYVFVTGSLPGTLVNMDPASIRDIPSDPYWRPFPVRQAWFFWMEWNKRAPSIKETKMLISASCGDGKAAVLMAMTYIGSKLDNEVKQEDRSENYDYTVPGSFGHSQFKALCGP